MAQIRYKTIVDQIAHRIRSGQLQPGAQLPTIRSLMKAERLALATASRIYAELEAIGLVVGEAGRGTFVRDTSLPRGLGLEQRPLPAGLVDLTFNYPSLPGQDEMLRDGLRQISAAGDLDALLHSAPLGGRPHERHTVARHLRNRGIRVGGEQVLIVNGAQQGLAVAVLGLLSPGDVMAIDALTYPGMKALAQACRIDLEALPQTPAGPDLCALEQLCQRRPVRAIYTMPTLHNPLGYVMALSERERLVALAEHYNFVIIEDGAYAFLAEPAPAPLCTLAAHRTVYVSGLSKSVAAGLRFGFVCAPLTLIPALERALQVTTGNTPSLTVTLCCNWIASGAVDALEQRKRSDAQQRQQLARHILRDCTTLSHPHAYYLWLQLPEEMRADQLAASLARQGVLVSTAEPFSISVAAPQAMRLALGSIGMDALAQALEIVRMATLG